MVGWVFAHYDVEPEHLRRGEVPADLLARFQAEPTATTCPTPVTHSCDDDLVVATPIRQVPIEKKSA